MKLYRFIILSFIILLFSSCNKKELNVIIGTVDQDTVNPGLIKRDPTVISEIKILNGGIVNTKATILKEEGQIEITFDHINNRWYSIPAALQFGPRSLLIRLFDKNGNYLEHFETEEKFAPEQVVKQYPQNTALAYLLPRPLKSNGNILRYTMNSMMMDHVHSIEIGFYKDRGAVFYYPARVYKQGIFDFDVTK